MGNPLRAVIMNFFSLYLQPESHIYSLHRFPTGPQLSIAPQPGPPPEAHPRHVGRRHNISPSRTRCAWPHASLGLWTTGPRVATVACSTHDHVRDGHSHDHDQRRLMAMTDHQWPTDVHHHRP